MTSVITYLGNEYAFLLSITLTIETAYES